MALDVNNFYTQSHESGMTQKTEYFDYMSSLLDKQQTVDTNALNKLYDATLNKLNTSLVSDLRETYLQSQISKNELNQSLARENLSPTGYGMTQRSLTDVAYADIRAGLLKQNRANITESENARAASLSQLMSDYIGRRGEAYDKSWMRYDTGYGQRYDDLKTKLGQDNWQKQFDEQKRQHDDKMWQQQQDRIAANARANAGNNNKQQTQLFQWTPTATSKKESNGNITYRDQFGNTITVKDGHNPYSVKSPVNNDILDKDGEIDETRIWQTGPRYQPNNIGGEKLKKVDIMEIIPRDETGTNEAYTQNVYVKENDKSNTRYIWYPLYNQYVTLAQFKNLTGIGN